MPIKINQDEKPAINLTPMIDIVFLLVIFFMVGTKFSEVEQQLELTVPEVNGSAETVPAIQRHVVAVFKDATVSLDGELMDLPQLEEQLNAERERGDEVNVVIRGDAEGAFQNVASVLSVCRNAGVNDLGVSVRMASTKE
ncbi:MAG: biopolymer transporter ExbD [Planctomycetaceae bacterium]|nr:biopolymer transporter ExbD [Planctomycetaceae bacterium]|tara:strand:- start:605 stop:1024 length:420 start_codon:yes stop_codon:yes gene_type:complete